MRGLGQGQIKTIMKLWFPDNAGSTSFNINIIVIIINL